MTIPLEKEAYVRKFLTKKYGMSFDKRRLEVSQRRNGNPILREFDAVSKDNKIVGEVKSDKHTEKAYPNR